MQTTPKSLKVVPSLEDGESEKRPSIHIQQENGIQMTIQSSPSYTQITPIYSPIYHSIQIPSNQSLISNPHQTSYHHTGNDDDKIPSTELPIKTRKESNKSPFNLCDAIKSFCKDISMRCCHVKNSKKRKFLAYFILLCMLVNLAPIIYLAVYHFRKKDINLTSVAGALSYIAYNLDAHPILDIQVQSEKSSCPQDYYSIIVGTWPGTTPGCDCGWLAVGYCDRSENSTQRYCDDVAPRKAIDMGGSKWCVQRAKLGSQYNKTVECAPGFRKCSSGICVLEGLNCPVTKVNIQSTGTYKLETELIDITPNDIPCFSDDYFASGPVRSYTLINQNENGCGKYGLDEQHSFKLDKLKQRALFIQNDFPSKVYNLPYYASVYEKTESVLSYRRRLSVAEKDLCLNIETEILKKSSKAAKDLNHWMGGTLIGALILHGFLILAIGTTAIFFSLEEGCREFLKGEDSIMLVISYLIIGFLELVDFIVMFTMTTHYRAKMMTTQDYLMKLVGESCFLDEQAQTVMNDYQVVVNVVAGTLFKYSLTLFIIGTFGMFACVYLLMLWKKR